MKTTIKCLILWALALVIYASFTDVHAQVVKNPENPYHSIPLGVDSNINRVLVAQFELKGSESQNFNDLLHLQFVQIEFQTDFIKKIQTKEIEFSYEVFGVATKILADIDNDGYVNFNSDIILTPVFNKVKVYILDLNSKNLTLGDTFIVKIKLGIDKDGKTPSEYLEVDPQTIFYGKKQTTCIYNHDIPALTIYPNPFVDVINIDLPNEEPVIMINSNGQLIYSGSSNDPIETTNLNLPSGEYFIKTSYGFSKVIK